MASHGLALRNLCSAKRHQAVVLRAFPTLAESYLWETLRSSRLGVRAHRQSVLRGYIADFWIPAWLMVVEVDGPYHSTRADEDRKRDANLSKLGIRTLRFSNDEVLEDRWKVFHKIKNAGALR